jgi:hypothetical protein
VAPRHSDASAQVAPPAAETPIFLDSSGRRALVVRTLGRLALGLAAAWAAGVVVGATGITPLPAPSASPLASRPPAPSAAGSARARDRTLVAQTTGSELRAPLDPPL